MTARLVLLLAALIISVDVVRDARRGRHIEARIVGLWVIFALAVLAGCTITPADAAPGNTAEVTR